jgi:hypothetical protein
MRCAPLATNQEQEEEEEEDGEGPGRARLPRGHGAIARAVGCLDGGADMCAQLWASKAQVGSGEGLELLVVDGGKWHRLSDSTSW